MFKQFLEFWRGKDFMQYVSSEFRKMLDETEAMFREVRDKLLKGVSDPDLKNRVYEKDRNVNLMEREIRKRVIEHLAFQPSKDVPACLILMSVVKDAERLGDYTKNLFEVSELLAKPMKRSLFEKFFNKIDEDILQLFAITRDAFLNSDEEKGRAVMQQERSLIEHCDNTIDILADSQLSTNEAVCLTLTARYFKRLVAHLGNIASSVVASVPDLDYFDGKEKAI